MNKETLKEKASALAEHISNKYGDDFGSPSYAVLEELIIETFKDVVERDPPKFKSGDKVDYHAVIGQPVTSTGHTVVAAEISSEGLFYWITNKRGCVAEAALSKAFENPDEER